MQEKLEEAIKLAVDAHAGQIDKAGVPYILHPLRVMQACETIEQKIVAILHDAIEDSPHTLDELQDRFGMSITDAVDALTRREGESYMEFVDRCGANTLARSVKLCDLADNMDLARLDREPTDADRRRQAKYAKAVKQLQDAASLRP